MKTSKRSTFVCMSVELNNNNKINKTNKSYDNDDIKTMQTHTHTHICTLYIQSIINDRTECHAKTNIIYIYKYIICFGLKLS